MRLQKFLSQAGVCSRRKAEELILDGRVKVNGDVVIKMGVIVGEDDIIEFGGKEIKLEQNKVYIALNKPVGYISSATSRQGQSVLDLVDVKERIYPVGRLDKDSSGLIILTNDGELANEVMHPRYESEKEYEVYLNKMLADEHKKELERGMELEGKILQPVRVVQLSGKMVHLVLKEGVNRQIRRMMGQLGYRVKELKRVRVGKLKLEDLNIKEGEWKEIDRGSL